jgi:hypothetical protein
MSSGVLNGIVRVYLPAPSITPCGSASMPPLWTTSFTAFLVGEIAQIQ